MRNKKPKTFIIQDKIYKTDILVCCGTTFEKARDLFHKKLTPLKMNVKIGPPPNPFIDASIIVNGDFKGLCMWFRWTCPGGSTVTHETFHATHHILSRSGITLTDESEEAYAYHTAWLVREIGNKIW